MSPHTKWKLIAVEVGVSDMGPNGVPVYELIAEGGYKRIAEHLYESDARRLALCWNTHDQLVAALEWHEQFMPRDGESSSGRYDRIAEVFYKETGYIAPGKDAPMCSGTSYEDRLAAWDKWAKDGLERTRAAIKAAKGEA